MLKTIFLLSIINARYVFAAELIIDDDDEDDDQIQVEYTTENLSAIMHQPLSRHPFDKNSESAQEDIHQPSRHPVNKNSESVQEDNHQQSRHPFNKNSESVQEDNHQLSRDPFKDKSEPVQEDNHQPSRHPFNENSESVQEDIHPPLFHRPPVKNSEPVQEDIHQPSFHHQPDKNSEPVQKPVCCFENGVVERIYNTLFRPLFQLLGVPRIAKILKTMFNCILRGLLDILTYYSSKTPALIPLLLSTVRRFLPFDPNEDSFGDYSYDLERRNEKDFFS